MKAMQEIKVQLEETAGSNNWSYQTVFKHLARLTTLLTLQRCFETAVREVEKKVVDSIAFHRRQTKLALTVKYFVEELKVATGRETSKTQRHVKTERKWSAEKAVYMRQNN